MTVITFMNISTIKQTKPDEHSGVCTCALHLCIHTYTSARVHTHLFPGHTDLLSLEMQVYTAKDK